MKVEDLEKPLIWILEDNQGEQFVYEQALQGRFRVRMIGTLSEFVSAAEQLASDSVDRFPHLMIADLHLADGNFLDLLGERFPRRLLPVPLMVVSSLDEEYALAHCFERGAADYLTKPFSVTELKIKVDRLLARRSVYEMSASLAQKGGLRLDPVSLRVVRGAQESMPLTSKEFQIFSLFEARSFKPIHRDLLVRQIWRGLQVGPKTVEVHISNLRSKIAKLSLDIRNGELGEYILADASGVVLAAQQAPGPGQKIG